VASGKRDRRRSDIAKFLEAYRSFGAPQGNAAEQAIWVILSRHGTKEGANKALSALWRRYVDVNELRVAKSSHIAIHIGSHVKNDAMEVAEQVRGFLRRWHKDQHTVEFQRANEMTPEQLKKYLSNVDEFGREIALALFLQLCAAEAVAEAEEAAPDADPKKKRAEKEVTASANRLRLVTAFAAQGKVTAKSAQANNSRALAKAWTYAPLPAKPAAPQPAGDGPRSTSRKTGRKTTTRKTTSNAAAAPTKGGGTVRPKTTRAARVRAASKKSSRR
jgi:hypothetical protein